ncbi:FKBP-type peptidyl-prolyl cis-trans isomerase [Formosa sp. PL04]|uniref:FKBP-type peptidyl-prolyl cis-trans isomerase n=1 Tax=Formosa sp. PL04 TaxID=3081755 RepID=UPI002980C969|nr:FKBP-type peptidyl-prolyl cis-trans isomerase [Formosa sp. PL04]MDW5288528.1 FKBP-type peptidyl-prolyl cis-trans isomerase [Formosa sp. PL04]
MKSIYIALLVVFFVSCDSNDDISTEYIDYTVENEQEILSYIANNNLDATRTDSGLYYVIDDQGEGSEITATSDVTVKFKGYFTNGEVFGENQDTGFTDNLQNLIEGWKEGLQLFNEGGRGILIIPAHLAYGSNDYSVIPGGSVVIYDIEVVDYDAENKQEIIDYIDDNNLDAQSTDSGLYYVIDEQGTGEKPTGTSQVTVNYKGYYTDGEVFDESTTEVSFYLDSVIEGWTEGLQLFNEGGSGKLLIPSALAYGKYGIAGAIPGGAVLIFDVELISVN